MIDSYDFSTPEFQKLAFECSLCNLCQAICPEKLGPGSLFMGIRREAVDSGHMDFSRYKTILGYEKKGSSPLFSYYALPSGCDTVFFPGCTLTGTRPETTWKLFEHLEKRISHLGIVLDCCHKPSHDIGRQAYFESMFRDILHYLTGNGIKKVLVACPNCHKMFTQYASGFDIKTVYEVLDSGGLPVVVLGNRKVVVHDPCPMREETNVQTAVRNLLTASGIPFEEMKHWGKKTLCCGEGGSVGFVRPELAKKWGLLRQKESENRTIVTYCAGCAGFLSRVAPTVHIADILFSPEGALSSGIKVARAPFTYLNRLKLKQRFKKRLEPCKSRVKG
ncbi:MAG: (Fe-S)-binding protein [Proteobacteria bacterium]|nr:(Fe-S)-binding protein [Pseudomonadota bacterium]